MYTSIIISFNFNSNSGFSDETGLNVPCEDAKIEINRRIQGIADKNVDNYFEEFERDESDDLNLDEMIDSNETTERYCE